MKLSRIAAVASAALALACVAAPAGAQQILSAPSGQIPVYGSCLGAVGETCVPLAQGSTTVAVNVSTATTTELVAASAGKVIYVTGGLVYAGGTGNLTFAYGTGTNCGTGTTSLSGAIPLKDQGGFTVGNGLGAAIVVPAGKALCVTTSAAVQMSGWLTYVQR